MKHPTFCHYWRGVLTLFLLAAFFLTAGAALSAPLPQADDPSPPDEVVKLIFIHHSTGGNWLADPAENELGGDLGRALMENNYFVSATNYGWGPDSIGDSTDIPNWLDWFRGPNSATYLAALYNENGQNFGDFGSWPRLPNDPGGENEIVIFKSCFPNSALEGSPADPPDPEGWLSVGHAKYVYNQLLQYFATRPDKLFIVITAPPLSDPEYAANARAFNNWLVNDWLGENNYLLSNVAVFDFYNVLTGPDAHHWVHNDQIEHIVGGRNTLYYPSGDDHPSAEGNRKATGEFVPLLNTFYHRWKATSALTPAVAIVPPVTVDVTPLPVSPLPSGTSGLIDDFEAGAPADTNGWEFYWDEATATRIACAAEGGTAHGGASALKIDFDVVAGSWATCIISYGNPQSWSNAEGVTFYLRADRAGLPFDVLLYAGTPESQETYLAALQTGQEHVDGWQPVLVTWEDFLRAEWEQNGGAPFESQDGVMGVGFGFDGLESASNTSVIWVDDLQLLGAEALPAEAPETQPGETRPGLPCIGGFVLPLAFVGLAWLLRKR